MLPSITSHNEFLNPGSSMPNFSFPEGASSALPAWDKVNFQTLSIFEVVADQYQDWGLKFEGAIALTPSNPSFSSEADKVVLMPTAGRKMVKVHLQQATRHIKISVRGAGIVNCAGLGSNGHCITRLSTDEPPSNLTADNAPALLPQQQFDLATQQLTALILESDSPFIIESICLTI